MTLDAAERRRKRLATWESRTFRGPHALAELERDALEEWARMTPIDRLALTWELSLDQYGEDADEAVERRLPRSAYRVERR